MDVFGGAPRFLAYPRPVVVQTGTDGVVKCQIGGDPRPAVIWERNNEQIHPEGRYRVFEDGNVYNLIITGATTEDSGQYICKAKNCIGETYAAATLKVEGEAQEIELREENKPRFLIKPLSTRVARGEDAVFSCKLWGNPRPEVVWEKDGRKLKLILNTKLWPHTQLKRPARRNLQVTATDLESHAVRVFLIQAGARDISRLHAAIHHRLVGMHCRAGPRGRGRSSEDEDERGDCRKDTQEAW